MAPPLSETLLRVSKAWSQSPPVIRERLDSVELEDDDLVESAPSSLLTTLVAALSKLDVRATSWKAADACAKLLARALNARAVIVHSHDPSAGELRVVGAVGSRTHDLLGVIESSDEDLVASTLLANGKPMTVHFDGQLPSFAPKRFRVVRASHSLVASPVIVDDRCLAFIEVIDPDEPDVELVMEASRHVADYLARVLSARASAA